LVAVYVKRVHVLGGEEEWPLPRPFGS